MTIDPVAYDHMVELQRALAASRQVCATYMKAVQNYEKGIKRLRKGVWSGQKAKDRVRVLEDMILRSWCGFDGIDGCARSCQTKDFAIHSEAREILKRRGDL